MLDSTEIVKPGQTIHLVLNYNAKIKAREIILQSLSGEMSWVLDIILEYVI